MHDLRTPNRSHVMIYWLLWNHKTAQMEYTEPKWSDEILACPLWSVVVEYKFGLNKEKPQKSFKRCIIYSIYCNNIVCSNL